MERIDAYINGQSLRGVDPRIILRETSDGGLQTEQLWGDNPGRAGQRRMGSHPQSRRLTVSFAVRELQSPAVRAAVIDKVNAWAQDGFLQFSSRMHQRIPVIRSGVAAIGTAKDYTEEFAVTFDAAPSPFWESADTEKVTISGKSASGQIKNLGSAPAEAIFTAIPTGGTLNTLAVTVGGTRMDFTGLAVAKNGVLALGYDSAGYQYIRSGTVSKLGCRAAASADDLLAVPGVNACSIVANVACNITIEVRSKWL